MYWNMFLLELYSILISIFYSWHSYYNRVYNTHRNPGNLLEFFLLEILEFYWNFARFVVIDMMIDWMILW